MYTHRMCGKYWSAEAALVGVGEYKRSGEKGFGKERVAGIGVRGRAALHLMPFCPVGC